MSVSFPRSRKAARGGPRLWTRRTAYWRGGKLTQSATSGRSGIEKIVAPATGLQSTGAAPAITDLISGNVDIFITTPPSVIGYLASGKVKAVAYTGTKRHPSMPNVPTSAEAGLPGHEVESWFAIFAPAKTPPEVIAKLTAEIRKIVESDAFRKKVDEQGAFATYMDPSTLGKFVDQELATWARVIKTADIKAE